MEKRAYMEQKQNSEKGKMKARLWEWGDAKNVCDRKCGELERIKKTKEEQIMIWQGSDGAGGEELLRKIEEQYDGEAERIKGELAEIMERKAEMDRMILQLEQTEQKFVELRYKKGYGFDYIGMKLYISRATLFRMQERILQKLISGMGEVETL